MRQAQTFTDLARYRHCNIGTCRINRIDLIVQDKLHDRFHIQNVDHFKMIRFGGSRTVLGHRDRIGLAAHFFQFQNSIQLYRCNAQDQNLHFQSLSSTKTDSCMASDAFSQKPDKERSPGRDPQSDRSSVVERSFYFDIARIVSFNFSHTYVTSSSLKSV